MILNKDIRVLIVEDNSGFTQLLKVILQEMGLHHIYNASNFDEGFSTFERIHPDVCLFDIHLGNGSLNGIQLAEAIRGESGTGGATPIIFLTSHYSEDIYEQARHTAPSGFLNKELSRFKLEQAIDIALMHKDAHSQRCNHTGIVQYPVLTPQNFFFKIGDVYKSIPVEEVAYFYSDQKLNYAKVGARSYPTSVQLKVLEQEFNGAFARIHKSYLVNIRLIESIHPGESLITIGGESLPIGYAYKKTFFDKVHLLK